jgi:hypothetical protein
MAMALSQSGYRLAEDFRQLVLARNRVVVARQD